MMGGIRLPGERRIRTPYIVRNRTWSCGLSEGGMEGEGEDFNNLGAFPRGLDHFEEGGEARAGEGRGPQRRKQAQHPSSVKLCGGGWQTREEDCSIWDVSGV
ncbi:hypothetical protein EYC84_005700 [Monilinia fructicola]|uniref:Uncharacterized protein n=1 Tax=Monilinia fructicola TaxID=38448 RepID=A0A5M9K229_MONFR|nr:hypothetical protein EYC84_005700 [Monilinia fructicola]